jgi:hypothetical protein
MTGPELAPTTTLPLTRVISIYEEIHQSATSNPRCRTSYDHHQANTVAGNLAPGTTLLPHAFAPRNRAGGRRTQRVVKRRRPVDGRSMVDA